MPRAAVKGLSSPWLDGSGPGVHTRCMEPDARWDVVRLGDTVRIDLTEARSFTQTDTDAIVAATIELITHEDVRAVRLDGPVLLQGEPPDGLRFAVGSLEALARRHGKRFTVGPM